MQNTTSAPAGRPARTKPSIALVVCGVLLAAAVVYIAVLQWRYAGLQGESARAIQAHVETILLQTHELQVLEELDQQVQAFNRAFAASTGRLYLHENLETNAQELASRSDLTEEAKRTLAAFQQNVELVAEMVAKAKELERYLGQPSVVKQGDNHATLVRRYLVDEAKLSPQEAEGVLRKTALIWDLQPGNQVFTMYHDGVLLSTVTQGAAKRTPFAVQWAKRQAALARVQELEQRVRDLEAKLAGAEGVPAPSGTAPSGPAAP